MQVTREDLNPCTVKLNVVCSTEQVKEGFNKAFKSIAKQVRVPGFRPGTAPRAVLEKFIPKEQVAEEAADSVIRSAVKQAIQGEKIEADQSTAPIVDLLKFSHDDLACEFTVKVPLPAQVELGDYNGLSAEKPQLDVTEDEVNHQIEELRRRKATREAVTDRGVQKGDLVVVDLKADEGDAKRFMVLVGETFPALDDALVGLKQEEFKSVNAEFPENFQDKDWAGKKLKVRATVVSINAMNLPELNDAFAQGYESSNLDELKSRMRDSILAAKSQMVEEVIQDALYKELLDRSKVAVSDNLWENLANQRLNEQANEQAQQGRSLEQFAQQNGMTIEQFVEAQRQSARESVIRALLIKEIFIKEKMQISNNDLNQALVSMAIEYGLPPQQMLEIIQKNNAFQELQYRAMAKMVGDLLISKANLTDGAAEAKPAKASKAKKSEEAPAEEAPKPKKAPAKKKSE